MKMTFPLTPPERATILELNEFSTLLVPMQRHKMADGIKKRSFVAEGTVLAVHPSPDLGDVVAPASGIIKDITPQHIVLECCDAPEGETATPMAPASFSGLEREALYAELKRLGVTVRRFNAPCDVFIINGLNTEPGMMYAEELFNTRAAVVQAGLNMLKRLTDAKEIILAVPEGVNAAFEGITVRRVASEYPLSLDNPMITLITGKESTDGVSTVGVHALFSLGMVVESGLPLRRTVVSVMGKNLLVPIGAPVKDLLASRGITPEDGDTVVLGGAMRGMALATLNRGVGKRDKALLFYKKLELRRLEENPCISCGECVAVCPMRLRPDLLSRNAQFERFGHCEKEYIAVCLECGLCGYVCPSCRPMQQHLRMAKMALGLGSYQLAQWAW